jgi:hypothetical protein
MVIYTGRATFIAIIRSTCATAFTTALSGYNEFFRRGHFSGIRHLDEAEHEYSEKY